MIRFERVVDELASTFHLAEPTQRSAPLVLVVISPGAILNHPLPKSGTITLGRSKENTIQLDDPSASRMHVAIHVGETLEVEDLDVVIADLKSKNVEFKSDVIHSPVCRMAVCLDSEGNSILLHQLKPKKAK